MSIAPCSTAVPPEVTSHHQDVLNDFVDIGHELARMVLDQAKAGTLPAVKATMEYDRLGRCVRLCIWLVRKLAEPMKTVDRIAARKQIIRTVEDSIQRHADPADADTLHEELMDRLDTLDLEDEIAGRPIEEIIADICRDLGLATIPGSNPWKRRTPADIAILRARAAELTGTPVASTQGRPQPVLRSDTRIIKP